MTEQEKVVALTIFKASAANAVVAFAASVGYYTWKYVQNNQPR